MSLRNQTMCDSTTSKNVLSPPQSGGLLLLKAGHALVNFTDTVRKTRTRDVGISACLMKITHYELAAYAILIQVAQGIKILSKNSQNYLALL